MWKIYYEDGAIVGTDPRSVKRRTGVVVIAQSDGQLGRELVLGGDWYYSKNGRWYAADDFGLMDQLLYNFDEIECVLQGRMVTPALFEKLQIRACDDPELPRKTAHRKTERL